MKKALTITLGIVVVLIVGFYAFNAYIYNEKQGDPNDIKSYRASLSGEVVCLPHKDTDGPQTLECALGLRTDVGEHYAIDFSLLSQEHQAPETGKHFSANGTVTPVEMLSAEYWQKYDIEGIFSVTDSVVQE